MVAMPLTNLTNQREEYYSFRINVEGIFHNLKWNIHSVLIISN